MSDITIYTTTTCPFCASAKRLLDARKLTYHEINVDDDQARSIMRNHTGGLNSVPQIFIGDAHIGGCDDLYALEEKGMIDAMLG